ncbi:hypothetical protein GE061_009096 [Apolygus lucorum]|uniref:Zinc finger DNA binding protein n=1 Tax=Apolygus lucorum TaxID=248454 RepID=A0A8S9Y1Y6_APOLU|nr:hypothetical protein GE061_009096 [Apolygus lucorum]
MDNYKRMRKEVREKWKCDKCVGTKAKENDKDDVGADKETQNKMDLNQKMDMLLSKFDSFQEKQDSFEASMDFFNSCFEDMKERFEDFKTELDEIKENQSILQNENVSLKEEVENLKLKVNDLDQLSLSTSVEIKGIPETHNENVLEIVKTLAGKLEIVFDEHDVLSLYRIKLPGRSSKSSGSGPIILRLITLDKKKMWIKQIRSFKRTTAQDLHPGFPESPIYINERLTAVNGRLFWMARSFAKEYNFRFAWSMDGKIFVKKDDSPESRLIRVFGEDQLKKMDTQRRLNFVSGKAGKEKGSGPSST